MPTVIFSKLELESLIEKKLPLEELKDRISMLGTDLEHIEGDEIKVEIFPNRPDLLSQEGFARALASFINAKGKTGLKQYNVEKPKKQLILKNLPPQWPFAIAFIAKGLNLDAEKVRDLIQLQEKIGVTMLRNRKKGGIGLYPLEKIHFPITFEGKNPKDIKFQPLDHNKILTAKQILEDHKKGKEYGHLMQDWKKYTIFTDAKKEIMSMPPIINSDIVGKIDTTTKNLFIECTGNDLKTITKAINIFASSLADMGATLEAIEVIGNKTTNNKLIIPDLNPTKMPLDLPRINKLLGLELTIKDAKKCLDRMGFGVEESKNKDQPATVLIPAYRNDILHSVDLAEDIAIAYGYENFTPTIPDVATISQPNKREVFVEKLRNRLIGFGLLEIKNYHLIKNEETTISMNKPNLDTVKLANSLGDHNTLRPDLISSLLKTYTINAHHEYPQKIFETGRTFNYENKSHSPKNTDTGILESEHLAVGLCSETADFTAIRQVMDMIARETDTKLEIKEPTTQSQKTLYPEFIQGRVGEIILTQTISKTKQKSVSIGKLGEIHPQVLDNWGIKMPIVALELNVELLLKAVQQNNK